MNYSEIGRRAEILTELFFTRFQNVTVIDRDKHNYDLLLDASGKKGDLFLFAIEVKVIRKTNRIIFSQNEINRKMNLPFLLTVVDIINDEVFFAWLYKPINNRLEKINILHPTITLHNSHLHKLTEPRTKEIISEIVNYYKNK